MLMLTLIKVIIAYIIEQLYCTRLILQSSLNSSCGIDAIIINLTDDETEVQRSYLFEDTNTLRDKAGIRFQAVQSHLLSLFEKQKVQ